MRALWLASILTGTALGDSGPVAREWTAPNGTVVKYRWSAPAEVVPGKVYPLVLFLHGAGERGQDNAAQLRHGVLPILKAADQLGQPCFLLAPQCPADRWWSPIQPGTMRLSAAAAPNPLLEAVLALVDTTQRQQPVDPKRFYVTGISMGGYATWDLLGRVPGKIAAAVPVCGGGDPGLAAKFAQVPVWAFHGEKDGVVPVARTREMLEALEQAGGKPKVTFYPDCDHDSWTQTYNNVEVIRWLFGNRQK